MLINTQVNKFISLLQEKYPHMQIRHDYNEDEDFHYIDHNYINSYKDEAFSFFVGGLIRRIFFEKDIFNISFGYSCSE